MPRLVAVREDRPVESIPEDAYDPEEWLCLKDGLRAAASELSARDLQAVELRYVHDRTFRACGHIAGNVEGTGPISATQARLVIYKGVRRLNRGMFGYRRNVGYSFAQLAGRRPARAEELARRPPKPKPDASLMYGAVSAILMGTMTAQMREQLAREAREADPELYEARDEANEGMKGWDRHAWHERALQFARTGHPEGMKGCPIYTSGKKARWRCLLCEERLLEYYDIAGTLEG